MTFRFPGYLHCADGLYRKLVHFAAPKGREQARVIVRQAGGRLLREEKPDKSGETITENKPLTRSNALL